MLLVKGIDVEILDLLETAFDNDPVGTMADVSEFVFEHTDFFGDDFSPKDWKMFLSKINKKVKEV